MCSYIHIYICFTCMVSGVHIVIELGTILLLHPAALGNGFAVSSMGT